MGSSPTQALRRPIRRLVAGRLINKGLANTPAHMRGPPPDNRSQSRAQQHRGQRPRPWVAGCSLGAGREHPLYRAMRSCGRRRTSGDSTTSHLKKEMSSPGESEYSVLVLTGGRVSCPWLKFVGAVVDLKRFKLRWCVSTCWPLPGHGVVALGIGTRCHFQPPLPPSPCHHV